MQFKVEIEINGLLRVFGENLSEKEIFLKHMQFKVEIEIDDLLRVFGENLGEKEQGIFKTHEKREK